MPTWTGLETIEISQAQGAHTALPLSREDCPVVHLIAVEGRMLVMGCWGEWLERLDSGSYAKDKHRHEVLYTSVGYSDWRQW